MRGKGLHKLGTREEQLPVRMIRLCSICLYDVDLNDDDWTTIIVNGRRAYYHKACLAEEKDA